MQKFTVNEETHKLRLDKYLVSEMTGMNRSQIKKLILSGSVLVNGKKPSVHQFLKLNDVVELSEKEVEIRDEAPELEVLAQGEGYLVINKPAGLLTHGVIGNETETSVAEWLIKNYPEAKTVGEIDRPGIVHRLDRDTSGVLVVATTNEMYNHLKKQFHDREVKKMYTALITGHLPEHKGRIEKFIGRSNKEGRMAARAEAFDDKDREAITDYEVMKSYLKHDLVHAYPLTGRTHQIRVHFHSMGTPVVGDKLYTIRAVKDTINLDRVFLHATTIEFTNLAGERIQVEAPLPEELSSLLDSLR